MMAKGDNLPYLYFVFSRHHAESLARDLGRRLGDDAVLDGHEQLLMREQLDKFEEDSADQSVLRRDHRHILEQGIGYHHAGLHVSLKALTERLYEAKLIKVLYCTSTFALGINMPARAVVFDGLFKFNGQAVEPLTTRQLMQKAGRAGRRGMDDTGHVIIRMDPDDYNELKPLLDRYEKGAYEPVKSGFNLSRNSIVNLIERYSMDQIREITDKSFLSWHLRRQAVRR